MMREATVERATTETRIRLSLNLDGTGRAQVHTNIGFFDHMLTHIARHGLFDLSVDADGDLEVDGHHTVEDVGICLGKAFSQALGKPAGIVRYGHAVVPMDEALAEAAIDISGRPFFAMDARLAGARLGDFDVELAAEFFRAFAMTSQTTLHVILRKGDNLHHCVEALFKAFARALDRAVQLDARVSDVPSTKGTLET